MQRIMWRKKIVFTCGALAVIFCLCAGNAWSGDAQPPSSGQDEPFSVSTGVDRSVMTIGDKLLYTVRMVYRDDFSVERPDVAGSLGGFTIKDFGKEGPDRIGGGRREESFWYELDTFVVGAYIIPGITVKAKDAAGKEYSVTTPEIFIEVKSVIADNDKCADIRDIKTPLAIPRSVMTIMAIVAGVILVGAAGFGLYWWRVRRNRPAPVRSVPPHEAAYAALTGIQNSDLIGRGELKEYYFQLTTCLREYLEGQFRLNALEQTTEEFIEDVLRRDVLKQEQKQLLSTFLQQCDFVKFARYMPVRSESEQAWETVKRFVDETKPVVEVHESTRDDKR